MIEFEGSYYFHKSLIHYRKENVVNKYLEVGQFEEETGMDTILNRKGIFVKENSIWADYAEDSDVRVNSLLQFDVNNIQFDVMME